MVLSMFIVFEIGAIIAQLLKINDQLSQP